LVWVELVGNYLHTYCNFERSASFLMPPSLETVSAAPLHSPACRSFCLFTLQLKHYPWCRQCQVTKWAQPSGVSNFLRCVLIYCIHIVIVLLCYFHNVWCSFLLQQQGLRSFGVCMYVPFYTAAVSTWTLTTPRATWESLLLTV
jgi:hypothetical protein